MLLMMGILSTLLVAIGGLGLFGLGYANDALKSVYEDRTVPAAQLGEIRALQLHNRLAIALAVESKLPEVILERTAQVEANIAAVGKLWAAYMATGLTVEEERLAKAFTESRTKLVQEGLLPAIAALRGNDFQRVGDLMAQKIRPLSVPAEKGVDALVQLQVDEARKAYTEAVARSGMIRNVSLAAIAGGLLIAGLSGFALVRSIGRQLGAEPGEAAALARSVAAGDLSSHIALRSGDTTSLMAQLKSMQDSLSLVVSDVRRNSESVASASAQIAQGNNDLAARTEQQASALEQTAASMEQLSATVKQNAESARSGNQSANSARDVAAQGGEVVSRVVATMKDINDSSRKIADIIAVIDGIAFQTNILALNAAVEAARAGEQGRGFAVVATEVRSLAKRSADAAKEIKGLIGASVERVAQGTALVDQAGTTMTEVVTSITRVTDIMGQISAASTEQALGVAQVGEAVTQMDQATQQNAALVEESAAAAESLNAQAQHLVEAVAVFKLDQGNTPRAMAPTPKVKRASVPARLAAVALQTSGKFERVGTTVVRA
jgi:methyl-accepting chemotaxis protein-1 (serine sensor receptor)